MEILQTLIQECLERHAPLRRIKLTRPPAPWMNDLNIRSLQQQCRLMRFEAHKHQSSEEKWNAFHRVRNQLKTVIKKAKRTFTIKALSSRRPKDVWKVIHRILHPSSQPLHADPNLLNSHFTSTAERVTGNQSTPTEKDLYHLIQTLPENHGSTYSVKQVTYNDVLCKIKGLRSDCSCSPGNVPVKFIKLVAEPLASPLTHFKYLHFEANFSINMEASTY